MKSYIFYFSDRSGLLVLASSFTEAISKLNSEQLLHVVKVDVLPFDVL